MSSFSKFPQTFFSLHNFHLLLSKFYPFFFFLSHQTLAARTSVRPRNAIAASVWLCSVSSCLVVFVSLLVCSYFMILFDSSCFGMTAYEINRSKLSSNRAGFPGKF